MKKLRILTIDGGGARGTIAIVKLAKLEADLNKKGASLYDSFDMFAGTSTGAIIASMLASGYTAKEIQDLYLKHGGKIFKKSILRNGLFRSRYDATYFEEVLDAYLFDGRVKGRSNLRCVSKLLMIPVYNLSKRDFVLFKSGKDNVSLKDAVRASAGAPTYFDSYKILDDMYTDGGVAVNNPAMMCYVEALKLGYSNEQIEILSIGTGRIEKPLGSKDMDRGLLSAKHVVDILLTEGTQVTDYLLDKLSNIYGFKYFRSECIIKYSNGEIDDFSKDNLEAMVMDGELSYRLSGIKDQWL